MHPYALSYIPYAQKACTRIFWKTEGPGSFARDHQKVLRENSWSHLAQEVLVRFVILLLVYMEFDSSDSAILLFYVVGLLLNL